MNRVCKFRLYPSKAQEELLLQHLWAAKNLWNNVLKITKQLYENFDKFPTGRTLAQLSKDSGLYSQVAQQVSIRLTLALKAVSCRKKSGEKAGFPRFKNIDRMKSLCYPQSGFKLVEKKLRVTPFGEINIRLHRPIEGKIKTLSLKRKSSGRWFAVITVELPDVEYKSNGKPSVGIDVGLKSFATLSDGSKIKNPRNFELAQERLAAAQKQLSKKARDGKNRWKSKRRVARIHEKIVNKRDDYLHKLSHKFVGEYGLIALEKLDINRLKENKFGKQINDASWGKLSNMISYKAADAGCQVVLVEPKGTTKQCSNCGHEKRMPLTERIYGCDACGLVEDRDVNAAKNILAKATAGIAGSNARGVGSIIPTVKQEALTERRCNSQRLQASTV
ncbi:MAG: transposase [Candidatus Micrarchaeia archaeon]